MLFGQFWTKSTAQNGLAHHNYCGLTSWTGIIYLSIMTEYHFHTDNFISDTTLVEVNAHQRVELQSFSLHSNIHTIAV